MFSSSIQKWMLCKGWCSAVDCIIVAPTIYTVYLTKICLVNWDIMHIGGHFSLVNMAILSVRFS